MSAAIPADVRAALSGPHNHPVMTIAALYVDAARGPYAQLESVECWDAARDARGYAGPHAVVSHPPCGPWSRLRHMCGPDLLSQADLGPLSVAQVRAWGGVVEHPADSKLWRHLNLPKPGELPDAHGGYTLAVEQWWWGHRAVKPTWLYIVGIDPRDVPPLPTPTTARPPSGRARGVGDSNRSMLERLPRTQRHLTPPAFAAWLLALARRATTPPRGWSRGWSRNDPTPTIC